MNAHTPGPRIRPHTEKQHMACDALDRLASEIRSTAKSRDTVVPPWRLAAWASAIEVLVDEIAGIDKEGTP